MFRIFNIIENTCSSCTGGCDGGCDASDCIDSCYSSACGTSCGVNCYDSLSEVTGEGCLCGVCGSDCNSLANMDDFCDGCSATCYIVCDGGCGSNFFSYI